MSYSITTERVDNILVVRFSGIADPLNDPASIALEKLAAVENPRLVLSLADVKTLSSRIIGMIFFVAESLKQRGGQLVLCSVPQNIVFLIEAARIDAVLDILPTVEDALSLLREAS